MAEIKQSDYKRYYFYINDMGLLTVQLSNDPMSECISRTGECLSKLREMAKNEGYAEQFVKDMEEGIE